MKVLFNSKIETYLFHLDEVEIPTKQDDFVPIKKNNDSTEELYKRKSDKSSVLEFRKKIEKLCLDSNLEIINKPNLIELFISISTKSKKRFNTVDIDNLAKNIIDSLKGFAFEDDSQISSLICQKNVHPTNIGLIIGVTNLTNNKGLLNDLVLFRPSPD